MSLLKMTNDTDCPSCYYEIPSSAGCDGDRLDIKNVPCKNIDGPYACQKDGETDSSYVWLNENEISSSSYVWLNENEISSSSYVWLNENEISSSGAFKGDD